MLLSASTLLLAAALTLLPKLATNESNLPDKAPKSLEDANTPIPALATLALKLV